MTTEQALAFLRQMTGQIPTNLDTHNQMTAALTHLRVTLAEQAARIAQMKGPVTDIKDKKADKDAKTG